MPMPVRQFSGFRSPSTTPAMDGSQCVPRPMRANAGPCCGPGSSTTPPRRAARDVTDDVCHVPVRVGWSDAVVAEGVLNALSVWDSDALVDRECVP